MGPPSVLAGPGQGLKFRSTGNPAGPGRRLGPDFDQLQSGGSWGRASRRPGSEGCDFEIRYGEPGLSSTSAVMEGAGKGTASLVWSSEWPKCRNQSR